MLELENFNIAFGGRDLFSPITININDTITVLMGRSGIGKSSIINAINSDIPYRGVIKKSSSFTVFQETHQLFPWFSIRKNLNLVCNDDYLPIVKEWHLEELLDKYPNQVSGGQRQRFTLIRAICSGCKLLLCDEPLSALDNFTRLEIISSLKALIKLKNITVLWVTHDPKEASLIGDNTITLSEQGISP